MRRSARWKAGFVWPCVLLAGAAPGLCCGKGGGSSPPGGRAAAVVTTKTGVEMVVLPGGWFEMGSAAGASDEAPVRRVWVDGFLMDRYEVTQDQFRRMSMPDPSHFKDPRRPVEHITLADAIEYCNERSAAEGLRPCYSRKDDGGPWTCDFAADGYRLPTEAEWEYACRAGTTTDCFFGAGGERSLRDHAWYAANSGRQTHPVGEKSPNAWGLYDMYGNVAEWCGDWYDPNAYRAGRDRNPRGPAAGKLVVLRGGAWDSRPDRCRSAARAGENPRFQDACFARDTVGFRCVRKATDRARARDIRAEGPYNAALFAGSADGADEADGADGADGNRCSICKGWPLQWPVGPRPVRPPGDPPPRRQGPG
jgi:formylglycine-generating enzyme required for sulfatase activity